MHQTLLCIGFILLFQAILLAESSAQTAGLLKMIDRPRVPLAGESSLVSETDGLQVHHFSYATQANERVPGVLAKKKSAAGRLPVVVVLHGTGGNKDSQQAYLKQLANRDFIAIAIDGRYHGERAKPGAGSKEYVEAMLRTYRTGTEHPFLYDTVWDVMRLVDYLETRPDVDPARIGLIGFSKGGMETYLAAALDKRIRVAVPCIGVQSFRWALDNNSWQSRVGTFQAAVNTAAADAGTQVDAEFVRKFYDRVAPGVYSDFDGPAMLPLIAPRPLLVINGDSDPRTPQPGLLECVNAAKASYAKAQASERFEFLLQPNTGHKVNPESLRSATDFFAKWLLATKPVTTSAGLK